MLLMSAHEMVQLGAAVTGTVDGDTYDPDNLCDGDPHNAVKTPDGTCDFDVTAVAAMSGLNGIALLNHNLDEDVTVNFSGLGDVVALPVPASGIRLNPFTSITASGSVTSFTVATSGGSPSANSTDVVIGEAVAGIFRDVLTLPLGSTFGLIPYGIPHPGEFGGLAYDKGGEARGPFGGDVWVDDATAEILTNAWRASKNNSRYTVIVPWEDSPDCWAVTWEEFTAEAFLIDLWRIHVVWREIARLRWPA